MLMLMSQLHIMIFLLLALSYLHLHFAVALSIISPMQKVGRNNLHPTNVNPNPTLDGDWVGANIALQNPDCCVVSVPNLEKHLQILQTYFVDHGPSDLDLRARVRIHAESLAYKDCLSIRRAVVTPLTPSTNNDDDDDTEGLLEDDACTNALVEISKGVASLAKEAITKEKGSCSEDVFIRIVCASNYQALDPMYHTDKSPLRGYVTLKGVGTEYMTKTSSPIEYATLRGLGGGGMLGNLSQSIRQANELEFIVMKGDEYAQYDHGHGHGHENKSPPFSFMNMLWKRRFACVHRSPPAAQNSNGSKRRVIISLDLADGDDDREWYQIGTKREWRCGMTQRKSRLVA